ncbi:MAG: hypothetical protein EU539_06640 [Promethearchaeota archaeon]|nr:MAG: hypothetical protein EU539_06640 [Candidatus Lokiarchaeota archaeon]
MELISCKECGWDFPEELIEKLIEGEQEVIFCESCGAELNKNDVDLNKISKELRASKKSTPKTLVDVLTMARKKSAEYSKKLKSKLKEFKEKSSDQS